MGCCPVLVPSAGAPGAGPPPSQGQEMGCAACLILLQGFASKGLSALRRQPICFAHKVPKQRGVEPVRVRRMTIRAEWQILASPWSHLVSFPKWQNWGTEKESLLTRLRSPEDPGSAVSPTGEDVSLLI